MATEVFAFKHSKTRAVYIILAGVLLLTNAWLYFSSCYLQGNLILSELGLSDKRIYHATLNGNLSQTRDFHQKEE